MLNQMVYQFDVLKINKKSNQAVSLQSFAVLRWDVPVALTSFNSSYQ